MYKIQQNTFHLHENCNGDLAKQCTVNSRISLIWTRLCRCSFCYHGKAL